MRQLTGLDAAFLHMENDRTVGHVAGLLVLDPSTRDEPLTAEVVKQYVADRLHLLPPMRWRLVRVPFGVDLPYWRDDVDVDLDHHVRGIALPRGSGAKELKEQVARLVSRRLDRAHPLWEIYVIEGLEHGRVAILSKTHHAAVDGQSGIALMTTLLSADRDATLRAPAAAELVRAEPEPRELAMLARGVLGVVTKPGAGLRLTAAVVREGFGTVRTLGLGGVVGAGTRTLGRVPRTSFNATLSARRSWTYGSISLDDVKKVKAREECTVNDVVMTLCAGALRRWLADHDELTDRPLVAAVPISIRTADQAGAMGNQVSGLTAALPTHLPDPIDRLHAVRDAMRAAKQTHDALPAHLLTDFSNFTAPAAAEFVARLAAGVRWADRLRLPYNVTISNVPGPRETLWFAGAELVASYPISMIADGMGLNITLQSYRDRLDFGLVSTPELMPDLDALIGYLHESMAELLAA